MSKIKLEVGKSYRDGEGKVISTISYDRHEIIRNIVELHCPQGIELDPTFLICSDNEGFTL